MEKREALRILLQCADDYHDNLEGKNLLIISVNNSMNRTFAIEILFEKNNFMHLTGIKFREGRRLSPDTFYVLCRSRRLRMDSFELADDGTTERKLLVLPGIVGSPNIGANMIGDYHDRKPVLVTEKLAGNIRGCIGIVFDAKRNFYVPNTVLNLDMRQSVTDRQRIIATYQKHKSESRYQRLVYKAKKIDWSRVQFPANYTYIPIPE